jgi:hypothetical protein
LPLLVRGGVAFWPSLALSCGATAAAYVVMVRVLGGIGVRIQ